MAIFWCKKCNHLREVGNDHIGKAVKCPSCQHPSNIRDTATLFGALIKKHVAQTQELNTLRLALEENRQAPKKTLPDADSFDINNTDVLTQELNLKPIADWFRQRKITASLSPEAADTTGFFDEVAIMLGENYQVLSYVSNQIKYVQNKGYINVKLDLTKKSQKEVTQITSFCKSLYDYSFVAKYYYQKKQKIVRLTLQTAPKIREFFNGIWMEWYAMMKVLAFFERKKLGLACSRNVEISFSAKDCNELDIFVLTHDGMPICIECKTGEFRQDIDKYLTLRKKLKLDKRFFLLCVFGLSDEQTQGMSSMYDLTFVNENNLLSHVESLVRLSKDIRLPDKAPITTVAE